jgi:hypothetical protein
MKQPLMFLYCLVFSFLTQAQKDESKDYTKMKDELNEKIFGSVDPYFKNNTIPDQYKNESAVVIAQKHTLESDSKFKYRIGFFASTGPKFYFFDIFRKKIMINDQSALKEFSELSFTKLQSKNWSSLGKLKNYTFINIRVTKPNGTTKTVNVDESAVVLKDEKDEKKSKIAIPDLGIGDIIDYYVANYYQEADNNNTTPLLYVLGDDYPILNYVISLQLDSRIAAEYQCINGAPDFKITPDEEGGGNVLNMAVTNIPKIKGLVWSSVHRQLPVIRLNYKRSNISRTGMPDIKQGKVERTSSAYSDLIETNMANFVESACYNGAISTRGYKAQREWARSAWKDYIAKHPAANKPDSIAPFLFRYFNWLYFTHDFTLRTNFNNGYYSVDVYDQRYRISTFVNVLMVEFKQEADLLVVAGRNNFSLDNLFSVGDLSLLVRTNDASPQYFSFADNFDFQNAIPYYLQGEKAKVYSFDTKNLIGGKIVTVRTKSSSTITLPETGYKDNAESQTISANLDATDLQLFQIKRKQSSKGNLKKDEQAALTIFEEVATQDANSVGVTDDLVTQNNNRGKAAKKETEELQTLLQKARTKHKEDFENEIERAYDVKAKELKNYKILNFGATKDSPFEFEVEFIIEGWSKKAGNNYILDIGKLIQSQISIDKDQRQRTKDVYMPFPRSFTYRIEFTIPSGYAVDGIDKLNMSAENEVGGFKSVVKQEANKVIIDVSKCYLHSFESATKWPLLLTFLDKALEFNQQKILLKKI